MKQRSLAADEEESHNRFKPCIQKRERHQAFDTLNKADQILLFFEATGHFITNESDEPAKEHLPARQTTSSPAPLTGKPTPLHTDDDHPDNRYQDDFQDSPTLFQGGPDLLIQKTTNALSATATGSFVALGITQPAHAEGTRDTSMSYVAIGFESNSWTDNNNDGWITAIRMRYCSRIGDNLDTVSKRVYRERTLQPDIELRQHTWTIDNCSGSTWRRKEWGVVDPGKYHFTIKAFNGTSGASIPNYWRFNADEVTIYW